MVPVTEEQAEKDAAKDAASEEAKRRSRQVAVSVRGVFGGFWAEDAVDLTETIGATTMGGLSIRVTKGHSQHLAFEGEFVGGRSGTVLFRDVDWQTMQGDITRQASFGRLAAAGVIRYGTTNVLSTRFGVGVQGTSYDSLFTTGGTYMDGPGNSIEFNGLWSVGIGFDTQLAKFWTLGAGATFAQFVGSDARVLEGGIQLGYRWDP